MGAQIEVYWCQILRANMKLRGGQRVSTSCKVLAFFILLCILSIDAESPQEGVHDLRRRAAKKRKRKFARLSEGLRVEMVYRRRIPPLSSDIPSTSAQPPPPLTTLTLDCVVQQSSSSFSEGESSSYEKLFPSLSESCKKSPVKELRRSTRKKGKA